MRKDFTARDADGGGVSPKPSALAREPVGATPRRAMSPARRKRIVEAHAGKCAYPDCEVTASLEIDHTVALELGGKDADENCRPLCRAHHLQKTLLDLKMIAKCRRIIKVVTGVSHPKRPLKSRGFSTALRRKFDGTVERRGER